MLCIKRGSGFFSCCSVKLGQIVLFINENKKIPDIVDSSKQFHWYKKNKEDRKNKKDITFDYFENYNNITDINIIYSIDYYHNYQYNIYQKIDYKGLKPLIKKYFSPSVEIKKIIKNIEEKYKLVYKNICVLFYRGNDKNKETIKCSYDEYLNYANILLLKNPKVVFLIQSDESEFIKFMRNKFPNNSFYFKDEIRHMTKCNSTVDKVMASLNYIFSKKYLAITIIMSRCKYIICGSGNCDIWIMLYRGNSKNVLQNRMNSWYSSIYIENKKII